jgi:catechol 2,3-dioxygenase-like lactoylglutathione lyase family enzyme
MAAVYEQVVTGKRPYVVPDEEASPSTWKQIDTRPALRGEMVENPPTMLHRSDGQNLLYSNKLHWNSGEPEGLKSWLAQIACADAIMRNHVALYVDFEDSVTAVVERLRALGATDEAIESRLCYFRPEAPATKSEVTYLLDVAAKRSPAISVIDGVNAAMGADGLDPNKSSDFYKWWQALGAPLRKLTAGPTVAIDHVVKNPENRAQYASGTGQKLAAVDVHFGLNVTAQFGRGLTGRAEIMLLKDRPGHLRKQGGKLTPGKGTPIGLLVLVSDPVTGMIRFAIDPPDPDAGAVGFRPTHLMERVSMFCSRASSGTEFSKTAIKAGVSGKADAVITAIDVLADEGYLATVPTKRAAYPAYVLLKPYHELLDPSRGTVTNLRTAGQ